MSEENSLPPAPFIETNVPPEVPEVQPVPKKKRTYTRKKKVEAPVDNTPKLLHVKTKGPYQISLRFVNVVVVPGHICPVADHPYVRRQIELGTIELVEN